jgi:hypothetical protein
VSWLAQGENKSVIAIDPKNEPDGNKEDLQFAATSIWVSFANKYMGNRQDELLQDLGGRKLPWGTSFHYLIGKRELVSSPHDYGPTGFQQASHKKDFTSENLMAGVRPSVFDAIDHYRLECALRSRSSSANANASAGLCPSIAREWTGTQKQRTRLLRRLRSVTRDNCFFPVLPSFCRERRRRRAKLWAHAGPQTRALEVHELELKQNGKALAARLSVQITRSAAHQH